MNCKTRQVFLERPNYAQHETTEHPCEIFDDHRGKFDASYI